MRVQTTIAANANNPTTAPTPIPAFVPSVIFDMMLIESTAKSGPSQAEEDTIRIDGAGGEGQNLKVY